MAYMDPLTFQMRPGKASQNVSAQYAPGFADIISDARARSDAFRNSYQTAAPRGLFESQYQSGGMAGPGATSMTTGQMYHGGMISQPGAVNPNYGGAANAQRNRKQQARMAASQQYYANPNPLSNDPYQGFSSVGTPGAIYSQMNQQQQAPPSFISQEQLRRDYAQSQQNQPQPTENFNQPRQPQTLQPGNISMLAGLAAQQSPQSFANLMNWYAAGGEGQPQYQSLEGLQSFVSNGGQMPGMNAGLPQLPTGAGGGFPQGWGNEMALQQHEQDRQQLLQRAATERLPGGGYAHNPVQRFLPSNDPLQIFTRDQRRAMELQEYFRKYPPKPADHRPMQPQEPFVPWYAGGQPSANPQRPPDNFMQPDPSQVTRPDSPFQAPAPGTDYAGPAVPAGYGPDRTPPNVENRFRGKKDPLIVNDIMSKLRTRLPGQAIEGDSMDQERLAEQISKMDQPVAKMPEHLKGITDPVLRQFILSKLAEPQLPPHLAGITDPVMRQYILDQMSGQQSQPQLPPHLAGISDPVMRDYIQQRLG